MCVQNTQDALCLRPRSWSLMGAQALGSSGGGNPVFMKTLSRHI